MRSWLCCCCQSKKQYSLEQQANRMAQRHRKQSSSSSSRACNRNTVMMVMVVLIVILFIERHFQASLAGTGVAVFQLLEGTDVNRPKSPVSLGSAEEKALADMKAAAAAATNAADAAKAAELAEKSYVKFKPPKKRPVALGCKDLDAAVVMRANDLRMVGSNTDPAFVVGVFDVKKDTPFSKTVTQFGAWDPVVQAVINFIIKNDGDGKCIDAATKKRKLMLDVGANVGFFGLQAASLGCEVHFYEPQVAPQSAIASAVCLNGFGTHSYMYEGAVTPHTNMTFPANGVKKGKTANLAGLKAESCTNNKQIKCVKVKGYQLDDMHSALLNTTNTAEQNRKNPPILILKVDVEGYEPWVMDTAFKLLDANLVANVLFEFTPSKDSFDENSKMLRTFRDLGYSMAELPYIHVAGTTPKAKAKADGEADGDIDKEDHETANAVLISDIQLFSERTATYGDWRKEKYTDVWATVDRSQYAKFNSQKIKITPVRNN